MAEIKISQLSSGTTLDGTEVVPIVQGGTTVKITTQDIADLGGGGGASVNPTSGVLPYNNGGVFEDSGYKYSASSGVAFAAIGMDVNDGEAIINCAMSSPTNGVFRASSGNGAIWVGPYGASYGVGFNTNNDSMLIGSSLMSTGSYSTIARWAQVSDENGNQYYLPLYK